MYSPDLTPHQQMTAQEASELLGTVMEFANRMEKYPDELTAETRISLRAAGCVLMDLVRGKADAA